MVGGAMGDKLRSKDPGATEASGRKWTKRLACWMATSTPRSHRDRLCLGRPFTGQNDRHRGYER